jgi:hypothetical protein
MSAVELAWLKAKRAQAIDRGTGVNLTWDDTARIIAALQVAFAPTHTDLMISPEAIQRMPTMLDASADAGDMANAISAAQDRDPNQTAVVMSEAEYEALASSPSNGALK